MPEHHGNIRVGQLRYSYAVMLTCLGCGRHQHMSGSGLRFAGADPHLRLADLGRRLRCLACGHRGGQVALLESVEPGRPVEG